MKFNKQSEQEIKESGLLADGEYKAKFFDIQDKDENNNPLLTRNGDEKMNATLIIFDEKERPRKIPCMLTPAFMKLFKHACDAVGLEDKYDAEEVTAMDFRRKMDILFRVKVSRRTYKNKEGNDVSLNNVDDFFKLNKEESDAAKQFSDDIAF